MTIAVYPGSFDPITNGHLDVIGRAAAAFDRVVVAVLANPKKPALFSAEERVGDHPRRPRRGGTALPADRIDVESFDGLTVDFCHRLGARFIVRGLRAISDFETEMQLAHNNRRLAPDVDTVFFMTSIEHSYVGSSLVKEIATFGGRRVGDGPAGRRRCPPPDQQHRAIIRATAAPTGAARATVPERRTEGTPIDIIFLVERLESIIANGKRLPLTNNVVVDQAAALGLIDELRVAVPEEVRAAKRINSEGERIIEKAQEEAERIVAKAQEQAAFLIDERGLTQQADAESRRIIDEAEARRRGRPARRRRVRSQRPRRARGRRRQDAPEHQEGDRPARHAPDRPARRRGDGPTRATASTATRTTLDVGDDEGLAQPVRR